MIVCVSYVYSETKYAQVKSSSCKAMWLIDESAVVNIQNKGTFQQKTFRSWLEILNPLTNCICSQFLNETYPAGQLSASWDC